MAEDLQKGELVAVQENPSRLGRVVSVSQQLRLAKVKLESGGYWDGDIGYLCRHVPTPEKKHE